MANYTIELREVVRDRDIFNFPYEFYDESKRREFEESFIRHFYFREIGCPTAERFVWYLQDKMRTVFPYYNSLFHTAQIEYSVLDNYNVTETFERSVDNSGKTSGVSSDVGRVMDEQNSETDNEQSNENKVIGSASGTNAQTETGKSTTDSTTNGETNVSRSGNESSSENSSEGEVRKFLDTPQGLLDLTEADYLTTINHDTKSGNVTREGENSGTEDTTNTQDENSVTDTERELKGNTSQETTSTETGNSNGKTTTNYQGEQKSTHDNNTRTEMIGSQHETYQHTKRGNIGVDTDADMIQKHINLQKVLTKIEMMFFEECEDLFMMVY